MVRRNFAQVLREGKIDLKNEYSKLYDIFYRRSRRDGKSIADLVSEHFTDYEFRGTCLTLDEFEWTYGINFVEQPQNFDIDYLVSFCEYIYNFIHNTDYRAFFSSFDKGSHLDQIRRVIEAIGYMESSDNGITIFVPKDNVAVSVAESYLIPPDVSYKVISYNHHSLKGNIEAKKIILIKFAELLEPRENELGGIDGTFKKDLFALFNNMNIRHNNIDPADPKNYKQNIAEMSKDDLEHWYDEIYQMCLLAFMRLEHFERRKAIDTLKSEWDKK